jgi:hypothetical protein
MGREYKELINNGNVGLVINHFDELGHDISIDHLDRLKQIHKNQERLGYNPVKYKFAQRQTSGREYPTANSSSVAPLNRLIRNTILDDYVELDVVAGLPTYITNLMALNKTDTPKFKYYIKNKQTLTKDHPEYKSAVNSLCNAEWDTKNYKNIQDKPSWLIELKDELQNIIYPKFKELFKEQIGRIHKQNAAGSFMTKMYNDEEQKWRNDMLWFMETKKPKMNIKNAVLLHDGIYLPKKEINEQSIKGLTEYMKSKYKVNIKVKDLDKLDLSNWTDCEIEYDDEDDLADNDYDAAEAFMTYMIECGHYFTKDYGHEGDCDLWWYNSDMCMWRKIKKTAELFPYIHPCDRLVNKYRTDTQKQNGMLSQFVQQIKPHEDFETFRNKSSKYKTAYKNGIWDWEQKKLIDFSKDIFFTQKINFEIDPSFSVLDDPLTQEIYDKLIYGFFEPKQAEFWIKAVGRGMAGAVEDKVAYVCISGGNSGKSIWTGLLDAMLGTNFAMFNGGNIATKAFNDDAEKSLGWLACNRHARIQASSEFEDGMTLSTETFKKLVGGGDKISARKMRENKVDFYHQSTFFLFMNDWFKNVSKMEAELKRRLIFLKPSYNYFTGDEYDELKHLPHIKKADHTIKEDFATNPKVINILLHIILQKYKHENPLNYELQISKELKNEYLDEQDVKLNLLEYIEITNIQTDLYPVKRLKTYLERYIEQIKNITGTKLKEHLTNLGLGYGSKYYQGKTQACYIGVKEKAQPRDGGEFDL